jgi:aromatic ring-cleaving dioxygenase
MSLAPKGPIESYHAHVYFDADSRGPAQAVRDDVEKLFDVEMGRWHEKLVGPHPRWSYQIAFQPEVFADIVPWLMLNRRGLTVFLHPNTGDDLADHTNAPVWMGEMLDLNLEIFKKNETD